MKWTLRCSLEDLGRVDPRIFYIGFLIKIVINFCTFSAGWALDHRDSLRNAMTLNPSETINVLMRFISIWNTFTFARSAKKMFWKSEPHLLKSGASFWHPPRASFWDDNNGLRNSVRNLLRPLNRLQKNKKLRPLPKTRGFLISSFLSPAPCVGPRFLILGPLE